MSTISTGVWRRTVLDTVDRKAVNPVEVWSDVPVATLLGFVDFDGTPLADFDGVLLADFP